MKYKTVEEAYKKEGTYLISCARRILRNSDHAIDCVNMAFEKVLIYTQKHPKANISGYLLLREVTRVAIKMNRKFNNEVSLNENVWDRGE